MGRIEVGSDTLHRSLAGETILINLASGICYSLDAVGNRIWQLIIELGDSSRIESMMVEEFDADPAQIAADLQEFLRELTERELIIIS